MCATSSSSRASRADLQFMEDYSIVGDMMVVILISLDAYWKFVKSDIIAVPDCLLATQSTVLGWMLYGSLPRGRIFVIVWLDTDFYVLMY